MKRSTWIAPSALLILVLAAAGCGKEKVCPADETNVGGTCYALQSDPKNCGSRGNVCGAAQGCSAGTCVECASSSGLCTTSVLAACFNLKQVRPLGAGLTASDVPLATDAGPNAITRVGGRFFVANSTASTVSNFTLSPPTAANGAASVQVPTGGGFADLEGVSARNGVLWISNAATSTLVGVDAATGAVVEEIPFTGSFSSPQGVDFVGTKAYVALNGTNQVAVVDLAAGTPGNRPTTYIDLSALGTNGANAAPARVLAVGTKVYVTLNDLFVFVPSFGTVTGAYGKLATIDSASDALVGDPVDLGADCWDASGIAVSGTTLWVACGYFDQFGTGAIHGGAIVPVELASGPPIAGAAIKLTDAATSVAICNGRGYAGMSNSGTVTSFDPTTRAVLGSAVACPVDPGKASFVPALACPN